MRSFLNEIQRHPDFIAIAILALILGLGRAPGIASARSLQSALSRQPAIESLLSGFEVKTPIQLPSCDRDFVILPSY